MGGSGVGVLGRSFPLTTPPDRLAFSRPRKNFPGCRCCPRSGPASPPPSLAAPCRRRGLAAEESRAALLERLYREHADSVYGLCLRMSGDPVRATELAQDVFVRAWEQLDRLQPGSDAGAWLWRLATNVVLNAMRSDRRRYARVAPVAEPGLLERARARHAAAGATALPRRGDRATARARARGVRAARRRGIRMRRRSQSCSASRKGRCARTCIARAR